MAAKKKPTTEQAPTDQQSWLGKLIAGNEVEQSDSAEVEPASEIVEPVEAEAEEDLDVAKPKLKSRHVLIIGSAIALVVFAWAICALLFTSFSVGQKTAQATSNDEKLTKVLSEATANYRLSIVYPNNVKKQYSLNEFGLSLDTKSTLRSMRHQASFAHWLTWWQPVKVKLVFNKNSSVFNNFIATSTEIVVQPSEDASLNIASGNITIANAVTGKQYGLNNAASELLAEAAYLSANPIKLQTLAVNPALTAKELEPYKSLLEKTLNQSASFTIGGQVINPSADEIASWLEITPDDKSKKLNITVNSGKILAYIDAIAAPLIHPAKAEVDVQNSDGSTQTLVAGVNGEDVTNKSNVATTVASNLLNGNGFSETLPVNYQPFETITAGNYAKWIEVDLTNKRLYAYEYTNLVMTDLVSAGAPATPTVTGQYNIYSKFVSQDMQGENVDGSTYFQPHVPWINYFYKDYAIHGNYWRPTSYFGNVNSSHGCVGLRDDDAEWIYNWAPIGTPVIIHN